jgi:hypothetical protein
MTSGQLASLQPNGSTTFMTSDPRHPQIEGLVASVERRIQQLLRDSEALDDHGDNAVAPAPSSPAAHGQSSTMDAKPLTDQAAAPTPRDD